SELVAGAILLFGLAAVRYARDDAGRTIVERGLEQTPPRRARLIAALALCGFLQLLLLFDAAVVNITGLYASPYPRLPDHLVNGLCDTPASSSTRYGPCPGSPDFRMPVRSLAGQR